MFALPPPCCRALHNQTCTKLWATANFLNGVDGTWTGGNTSTAIPNILQGKAVVKGTRLSVAFILQLLASGWSVEQILENYPTLTPEALRAVFAFASQAVTRNSQRSTIK
jgi:uncharacterized protein (DUF433 family)